jgi:hypothetical protein
VVSEFAFKWVNVYRYAAVQAVYVCLLPEGEPLSWRGYTTCKSS